MTRFVYLLLIALGIGAGSTAALATEKDTPFTGRLVACVPENANYPYYRSANDHSNEFPGLYLELLEKLNEHTGMTIVTRRAPWSRCMSELRVAQVNMVFTASYLPEREAMGCFPMLAPGQPNGSRRVISHDYHLYVRQTDAERIRVEDDDIIGLETPVGIRSGQSIANILDARNIPYLGLRSNQIAFRQLRNGRIDGVAMIKNIGDSFSLQSPGLVRLDPALTRRDYFLILDHATCQQNGPTDRIWSAVESLRESDWFKERERQYLQVENWMREHNSNGFD